MPSASPFAGSGDLVALGRALHEIRVRRGVKQEAVGYDAGLGKGYMSAIELGRQNPSFVTLLTIVRTLRVPLAELIEIYHRELTQIDPQAGHGVPACPTPEAMEYVRALADIVLVAYHARKAREARGRIKPWT